MTNFYASTTLVICQSYYSIALWVAIISYKWCNITCITHITHKYYNDQSKRFHETWKINCDPCTYLLKYEEIAKIVCPSKSSALTKANNHSDDRPTNVVYSSILIGFERSLLVVKMKYKYWKNRIHSTVRWIVDAKAVKCHAVQLTFILTDLAVCTI